MSEDFTFIDTSQNFEPTYGSDVSRTQAIANAVVLDMVVSCIDGDIDTWIDVLVDRYGLAKRYATELAEALEFGSYELPEEYLP